METMDYKGMYSAPVIEVLEINVEAGIAMSPGDLEEGGDLNEWSSDQ